MIIIYTPEGGVPERLDAGRMRVSEIQIAERTAERSWEELKDGLKAGDPSAVRTVAWVVKKRREPSLRFAQFDPYEDELVVRLADHEVRAFAVALQENYGDDAEQLAAAWEELRAVADDPAVAEAAIAEQTSGAAAGSPAPKEEPDPSATPETSTSFSWPTSATSLPQTSTP